MGDQPPRQSSALDALPPPSLRSSAENKGVSVTELRRPSAAPTSTAALSDTQMGLLLERLLALEKAVQAQSTGSGSAPSQASAGTGATSSVAAAAGAAQPSTSQERRGGGLISALQQRMGGAAARSSVRFQVPDADVDSDPDEDRPADPSADSDARVVRDAIARAHVLGSFAQWVKAQTGFDKRTAHETAALAEVIDHLIAGRTDQALQVAVLRLVAVQAASQYHNWALADVIYHPPASDTLLASESLRTALRNASALQRLNDRAASASRRKDRGDHKQRDGAGGFHSRDRSGQGSRYSNSHSGHRFRGSSSGSATSSSSGTSTSNTSSHQRSGQGNNNNAGAREN